MTSISELETESLNTSVVIFTHQRRANCVISIVNFILTPFHCDLIMIRISTSGD